MTGNKVLVNQSNGLFLRTFTQTSNSLGKDFSIIETPNIDLAKIVDDGFDVNSFNNNFGFNFKMIDRGYL